MQLKSITIEMPTWLREFMLDSHGAFPTCDDRMEFVISLARKNIEHATGGPFAAAIFNPLDGELIAPGINLVTTSGLSTAHAEMVAIMGAQTQLGKFDLGAIGMPFCELVTSVAPCAMCLGAIPWSGVRSLVCGARDEDARAVGFDEGSKRGDWAGELEKRGIAVTLDVMREEAAAVLRDYAAGGGIIYNGRQNGQQETEHEPNP